MLYERLPFYLILEWYCSFLAIGTLPNHNKNHSKIFFPILPICSHTHRRLWWFDTVVLYPRTQSQPGLTHFMWWSCSFVEKPFVTGGCESVLTFSFSWMYFPPFHLSVHISLRLSSLVFIPLFVFDFVIATHVSSRSIALLVSVFTYKFEVIMLQFHGYCNHWVEMHCGRFQRTDLHQRFTCAHIQPWNQVTICSSVPKS